MAVGAELRQRQPATSSTCASRSGSSSTGYRLPRRLRRLQHLQQRLAVHGQQHVLDRGHQRVAAADQRAAGALLQDRRAVRLLIRILADSRIRGFGQGRSDSRVRSRPFFVSATLSLTVLLLALTAALVALRRSGRARASRRPSSARRARTGAAAGADSHGHRIGARRGRRRASPAGAGVLRSGARVPAFLRLDRSGALVQPGAAARSEAGDGASRPDDRLRRAERRAGGARGARARAGAGGDRARSPARGGARAADGRRGGAGRRREAGRLPRRARRRRWRDFRRTRSSGCSAGRPSRPTRPSAGRAASPDRSASTRRRWRWRPATSPRTTT